MDMSRYAEATAAEIAAAVRSGRTSATAVVGACIDRIAALEPRLNTLVTLTTESALEAAHRVDALVAAGRDPGPLAGVPVTVKDLIAVGGVRQAFGSRLLADNVAAHDAPSVERLRVAGACIVGKSTTSELGSKAVGDSPLTGITRNPWNADHTSGGSSAGAAAGVAAGMVPVALATDGGGSIRIPSSFCGVFGIKARFGRVPVWPPAATPLLAHVGPITRSVADAALVLSVIAGHDPRDSASVDAPVPDLAAGLRDGVGGLRIGWCSALPYGRVDPLVAQRCREAAFDLAGQGARVVEVEWPFPQDPGPAWNHLFYGRIGGRVAELAGTAERMEMVNASLREAIAHERAAGIGDAAALALREQAIARAATLFRQVDLLLTPTMPVTAPRVGVDVPAGHAGRNAVDWSYFTYPFNLTGHPAASIPVGFDAAGLPIGLQLVGGLDGEATILRAAAAIERVHPVRIAPV